MKQIHLVILLFVIPGISLAQHKYYKGNFKFEGKITSISVSPDGTIWLPTYSGYVYTMKRLKASPDLNLNRNEPVRGGITAPHFDYIAFFNNDTAFISGYISKKFYEDNKNEVYRTNNGGKDWSMLEFTSRDMWVRDVSLLPNGKAWMAGMRGRLFYTTDYGTTWTKLPKMFTRMRKGYYPHPDARTIYMQNDSVGIAGNRNNQIAITHDNFKRTKRIPTPLDQGLYPKQYKPYYLNGKGRKYIYNWTVNKVRMIGDYYILDQYGTMYYTKKDEIKWKRFSPEAIDFEVDRNSNTLYVVTKDLEVLTLDASLNLKNKSPEKLKDIPSSFAIHNGGLFILVPVYYGGEGEDKIVDEVGNLVVIQKNVRVLKYYYIYSIKGDAFEKAQL